MNTPEYVLEQVSHLRAKVEQHRAGLVIPSHVYTDLMAILQTIEEPAPKPHDPVTCDACVKAEIMLQAAREAWSYKNNEFNHLAKENVELHQALDKTYNRPEQEWDEVADALLARDKNDDLVRRGVNYVDRVTREHVWTKNQLSGLLDRIHKDCGQYEEEHGTDKAVADAIVILRGMA
jgi:hypothetical protein